ncbi:MAG: hypothetical protein HC905_08845 [Bacteroidales bacterium]|nr:hypothetical protein [Bacteroidales bacterium]
MAILFITRSLSGQLPNLFDKLTVDDGLSNNTVTAIQQDKYGRMWFGTYDGLNCYDGQTIRTFRNIASNLGKSYTDNQITMLFEDKQGTLWVVQPNSIVSKLIDYEGSRFQSFRLVPSNIFLTEIIHNENGSITLLGNNGGFEFDQNKNQFIFRRDLLDQKREPDFLIKYKRSNPVLVQRFWNYGDSVCLVTTLKDGLIKLYKNSGNNYRVEKIDQQADNPYSLSNNEVYSVYTDYSGIFWIGTKDGGVNRHLPQAQYLNMLCHKPGSVSTIPKGTIRAISQDQKGHIWIGSYNDGIAIYDPVASRYNFINHKNKPGSDDWDRIRCIYPSSDNRMWIGCYAGIFSIDLKTGKREYFSPGKGDGVISAGRVYSMVEDKNKCLWVGSWGGIDKIDLVSGKISKVTTPHLIDAHVRKLMFDRKGNLWIGTEFDGVYIYETQTGKSHSFKSFGDKSGSLNNNSIYSLYQSKSGLIWIGTSDGLNVYNPENEKIVSYSASQGLPAGLILGILEDNQSNIWLSTSKGVARVNTKTHFIRSYNKHDGWFNTEFSEGAYFKSKDGIMYLAVLRELPISILHWFHPTKSHLSFMPNYYLQMAAGLNYK